ncbi:MAG: hypothetical protein MUF22_01410, partial [Chitinispirillaceae bacterium]|nr:hypothetical protein [Chitinispirillaceae bacterium]
MLSAVLSCPVNHPGGKTVKKSLRQTTAVIAAGNIRDNHRSDFLRDESRQDPPGSFVVAARMDFFKNRNSNRNKN